MLHLQQGFSCALYLWGESLVKDGDFYDLLACPTVPETAVFPIILEIKPFLFEFWGNRIYASLPGRYESPWVLTFDIESLSKISTFV